MNQELLNHVLNKTKTGTEDSDAHLMTILSIGLSLKAKNILELGVRNGNTTLPLLLCAKENNGLLRSVDIKNSDFRCPEELESHWEFYEENALKFLERCDKKVPFDLIYLDDWHSYEHVKKELEYIDQMISPKGVVLVHDLMYSTEPYYHTDLAIKTGQWANGGPYRAVSELNDNFWEFATIPSCNGLTILRKKYSSKYHKI